ncbi:MAG: glycosyltransferase family 25 protein [Akkermansia sp.]|nr:glycosyltransferase family 25 protein [Akkermansia sp.]
MPDQSKHKVWNSIDGILVINLDTSADRLSRFMQENAESLPIERVQRLSAVLGRALPTYGKSPWFTEQTGERDRFWGGTAGCALSHRKAIEHARDAGWRNVLILEDDAVVRIDSPGVEMLSHALKNLRGDYMLYLGYNKPVPYGTLIQKGEGVDLWQVEGVLATHGYILPASMYEKVLALLPTEDNVWEWLTRYRAIDSMYRDYVSALPGVRIYALYPVLVDQGAAVSDIGGGAAAEAEYSCKRPPYSYHTLSGVLHMAMYPFRRLKVHLNSMRTRRRGLRSGLPGYRKRRKK